MNTSVSDAKLRFTIEAKTATDSSYKQWVDAMRMVVRLPGGIPPEFRRKLWITLSEKYIQSKQINWQGKIESCFSDRANPDDESLGEQIIKDLHRTGCDLFSGADASVNQALLKQVLLAFARWNKSVGYCQGFNILAAVILEVVEWKVEEALMVMIFLIEGLLPESYFANNLRGLSVDMAVFRDLMKIHLNDLSNHLDHLQYSSLEGVACYEPPLVNVFTLQWFLTLFSNCLPKSLVLRIWDLIFLEGSEVLLRTALIIWCNLSQQIYSVKSADEFYSIMGLLMMQLMEYTTTDGNQLITDIINLADFPYTKVSELREKYTYHIRPLSTACNSPSGSGSFSGSSSPFSFVKKGLHLLPFTSSSDEDDINAGDHFEFFFNQEQLISMPRPGSPCVSGSFDEAGQRAVPLNANSKNRSTSTSTSASGTSSPDRMSLDVSLLRKQYVKLCQRQKQAHLILTEGLRYGYSSTFNRSSSATPDDSSKKQNTKQEPGKKCHDKSTINSLLSGKPALTVKSSNKQPLVALPTTVNKSKSKDANALARSSGKTDANTRSHIDKINSSGPSEGKRTKDKTGHHRTSSISSSGENGPKEDKSDSSKNRNSVNNQKDKSDQACKSQPLNNLSESTKPASSGQRVKEKKEQVKKVNIAGSSNESGEDETGTVSDETSQKDSGSTCKETSHSSSTSINESSSSSSIESYASSGSTVDTVVMKKRKKSDEAALNSSQGRKDRDAESEPGADKSAKPAIVVVRRRFGPNVRRASSILEQSSFSIDEPLDGDDESTSSSDAEQKTTEGKDKTSSPASSSKGVSSKRKDFQRRQQNTMTLTWSEIRKIRKTSAPAAVIRSSLSSPPSDMSPPHDNKDKSVMLEADDSSNDSCQDDTSGPIEEEMCQQLHEPAREPSEECSPDKVIVSGETHLDEKRQERVEKIQLPPVNPVVGTAASTVSEVCSEQNVLTDEKKKCSTREIDQDVAGDKAQPAVDKMSSKQLTSSPKQSCASEEQSEKTTGPDGQETDCDNESEWDADSLPPVVAHAKSILQTLQVTHDSDSVATSDRVEEDAIAKEDGEDGEERIIKSVQSEISNLTIEECLARLSARISTLNSELQ